jgi:hypothetical protein
MKHSKISSAITKLEGVVARLQQDVGYAISQYNSEKEQLQNSIQKLGVTLAQKRDELLGFEEVYQFEPTDENMQDVNGCKATIDNLANSIEASKKHLQELTLPQASSTLIEAEEALSDKKAELKATAHQIVFDKLNEAEQELAAAEAALATLRTAENSLIQEIQTLKNRYPEDNRFPKVQ